MELNNGLEGVARRYRNDGYTVTIRPTPEQLPSFAANFDVQLLVKRGDESALVLVKQDRAELRASPDVLTQAQITEAQPGWRYDFAILNGADPVKEALRQGIDPTREQIEQALAEAERASLAGAEQAGFLLAWVGVQAAMRDLASRAGFGGGREGSDAELLGQVSSWGHLSHEEYRRVRELRDRHARLAHGFLSPELNAAAVRDLVELGRRLLAQTEAGQLAG